MILNFVHERPGRLEWALLRLQLHTAQEPKRSTLNFQQPPTAHRPPLIRSCAGTDATGGFAGTCSQFPVGGRQSTARRAEGILAQGPAAVAGPWVPCIDKNRCGLKGRRRREYPQTAIGCQARHAPPAPLQGATLRPLPSPQGLPWARFLQPFRPCSLRLSHPQVTNSNQDLTLQKQDFQAF